MLRFLPWKFIVRRAARAYGFADPALWLARIRRFAQPSEVAEPIELVRAGVLFHARGIVNARAIQHNLDWVWPYWAERQFDPEDISFIPRTPSQVIDGSNRFGDAIAASSRAKGTRIETSVRESFSRKTAAAVAMPTGQ